MPPSARPPRIPPHLPAADCGCAAGVVVPDWLGAACCAVLGAFAGGGVTLRWVPTLLPPPIRLAASASVTAMARPKTAISTVSIHLLMGGPSEPACYQIRTPRCTATTPAARLKTST